MPRASASGGRERMRFDAPRILNAPPRCRFSHLKKTRQPASASKLAEVMTGVLRASGRIRSAAARTSSAWIARSIILRIAEWKLRIRETNGGRGRGKVALRAASFHIPEMPQGENKGFGV